ncbi:MAG: serine/threonine protein kinase [Candidatus Eremiobacteraeota bacterium]|nr:serine/threonine protein kinase [Candidatus Eremiobacteraeota bacterium]
MNERVGTVIAKRYKIDRLIGRGGMADVYHGSDTVLGREIAIKILTDRSEIVRKRFLREAQSMASLNHPNVVGVYDAGEFAEQLYIIMELVRGKTLKQIAAEGLTFDRSIEIFIGLLEALDYAHSQSVIHRDIKPANVMILTDGTVKVMDFGLSRRVSDASSVTQAGEIVGTIAYLSPERFLGKTTDQRSDLYSVGCVMYEIFTGDVPFKSATDDLVSVIFAHVNEPPVPPRNRNRDLPPALERIILRLLEKDPSSRYGSAREAINDLKNIGKPGTNAPATNAASQSPQAAAAAPPPSPAQDLKSLLASASHAQRTGDPNVRELLNRAVRPGQALRDAQREVLAAMLATRKRDYTEAARAFGAALDGFRTVNNELEYARTALRFGAMNVEKNAHGDRSADTELDVVIRALSESLPILRGRRLFGELEEGERTLYALRRIKVSSGH